MQLFILLKERHTSLLSSRPAQDCSPTQWGLERSGAHTHSVTIQIAVSVALALLLLLLSWLAFALAPNQVEATFQSLQEGAEEHLQCLGSLTFAFPALDVCDCCVCTHGEHLHSLGFPTIHVPPPC